MIGWILFFAFMELYSIGMSVFLKKLGVKRWFLCLIPFAVFFYAQKLTGIFKIVIFPVKKWGNCVIYLTIVTALAHWFGLWAIANQNPERVHYLLDILWLIAVVCIGVVWLGIAASTAAILARMSPYNNLQTFACYLLVPIPFLLELWEIKPEKKALFPSITKVE